MRFVRCLVREVEPFFSRAAQNDQKPLTAYRLLARTPEGDHFDPPEHRVVIGKLVLAPSPSAAPKQRGSARPMSVDIRLRHLRPCIRAGFSSGRDSRYQEYPEESDALPHNECMGLNRSKLKAEGFPQPVISSTAVFPIAPHTRACACVRIYFISCDRRRFSRYCAVLLRYCLAAQRVVRFSHRGTTRYFEKSCAVLRGTFA